MQAVFAAVVSYLVAFDNLSNQEGGGVFVMAQAVHAENPRRIAEFNAIIVGNHHTIYASTINSLFGTLQGAIYDLNIDIYQLHTQASLANEISGCRFRNVRITVTYRITNARAYKLANYVRNAQFELFSLQSSETTKTQFALVFENSKLEFSIVDAQMALFISKSILSNCYIGSLAADCEIDSETSANASLLYCSAQNGSFCQKAGNQEIFVDPNGEFAMFSRFNENQSFKIVFAYKKCATGIAIGDECVYDECRMLEAPCSGRGKCIDFRCTCNEYFTTESACLRAAAAPSTIGSIAAAWTLAILALVGLVCILVFGILAKKRGKSKPEKDIPVQPAPPNEAAPLEEPNTETVVY